MTHEMLQTRQGYGVPCLHDIRGGEDLVCVVAHGFGSSKESPTAQLLLQGLPARGIGAAAIDFPIHGESPDDAPPLRLAYCFDALAAAEAKARALAPKARVVYFGSSFGAYTTLLYLAGRPHAGNRAFLRSAAVCMPELFHHRTEAEEAQLQALGYVVLGEDYGYARPLKLTRGFFDDLDSHDLFALWRPEEAALEMVHGELDETIPLAEARRFAGKFSVPLTVVPGGDHRLSLPGAPELVLERAAAFFLAEPRRL